MRILLFTTLLFLFGRTQAQFYSEPEKPKVKKEKRVVEGGDTARYLAGGFTFGASLGLNRTIFPGVFAYEHYNSSSSYYYYRYAEEFELKNAWGYSIGLNPGFHNRAYGLEFPVFFNVNRFKVPSLGAFRIKHQELEFGLMNYFKFGKEKNNILLGTTFGTRGVNIYFTLGYGYKVTDKLMASFRLHLNPEGDNYVLYDNAGRSNFGLCVNSIQIIGTYQLVSARKMKTRVAKQRKPKPEKNVEIGEEYHTRPAPAPARKQTEKKDYSSYSTAELKTLLKEATADDNLEEMLAIQKELDARQSQSQLGSMTRSELENALTEALNKEDYRYAGLIRQEMEKRGYSKPASEDEFSKKTKEQLKVMLDEAIKKEDYARAKKIQQAIDAKK